jgi:hypothetical protein
VFVHEEIVHVLKEKAVESILTSLTACMLLTYLECISRIVTFSKNGMRRVKKVKVFGSSFGNRWILGLVLLR